MIDLRWVRRASYLYLAFPFILFLFGWVNFLAELIILLVFGAGFYNVWRSLSAGEYLETSRSQLFWTILLVVIWVFLSGIGGFSFQNWDHHSRNALFRDLVESSWPVVYHLPENVASQFNVSSDLILNYYFGFWLPSALVGKVLGWNAANSFLFLWSLVGIFPIILLTASKTKLSLPKTALLFIFFSGLDFLGVLLFQNIPAYQYPKLWPPIQHLEWWAGPFGTLQYSSFTTGLFWTYNQFIPAVLVMSLWATAPNSRDSIFSIFLTGLCFFFAPIPALGMLLFALYGFFAELSQQIRSQQTDFWRAFLGSSLTFENFAGILVGLVSFLFFSTNIAAQKQGLGLDAPIILYLIFLAFEGMIVWWLLLSSNRKNPYWYIAGGILVLAPFVNVGGNWDFMMRVTLPALYMLMLGCGLYLSSGHSARVKSILLLLLVIGAITPLYEMNRSVTRLARFYEVPVLAANDYFEHPPKIDQRLVPEFDHPDTLVADDWVSISRPNTSGWATKVGSLFPEIYRFLWKEELLK